MSTLCCSAIFIPQVLRSRLLRAQTISRLIPTQVLKHTLVALVVLSSARVHAFDPISMRNAQLKSLFNVRSASVSVEIDYRFFEPIKPGESADSVRDRMTVGRLPMDAALQYNGAISKNLESILSAKMLARLKVQTIDWKTAPYRVKARARIVQSLDLYGANMFESQMYVDVQEFSTANSGLQGFTTVSTFVGQAFAKSKDGVEGILYESLDQAVDAWSREAANATLHCERASCRVRASDTRNFSR